MKKTVSFIKNHLPYILIAAVLAAYILSVLLPLAWALISSLREYGEFVDHPAVLPKRWTFANYVSAVRDLKIKIPSGQTTRSVFFEEMLLNSVLYSVGCSLVATLVPCITAYLVAKYKYRFGKLVYTVVIVTMILPIVGALPSELQVLRTLGLYNSLVGVFILKANFLGIYFLVFFASFKTIPWDFAEASFIDGASHLRVFTQIMLPMIATTVFAVFIMNFVGFWNDYMTAVVYMPSTPTVAYGLFYMRMLLTASFGTEVMQFAGCMLLSVPVITLFVIFQKRLMGNLTVGGIKG
jgi:ABC-type glycerol-3-phosphate transport system permease component